MKMTPLSIETRTNVSKTSIDLSLTRVKMQSALYAMRWNNPVKHPCVRSGGYVKTAIATPEFWEAHRGLSEEWKAVGIYPSKRGSVWYVKWWSTPDGKFVIEEPRPRGK